ncbi:MAG: PD-(D/E)XK nuclease family protein [Magnetococcales bacterium]|nr:PD-(D/E)XK nuclease family protein [Magnetococcales bacterium]
MFKTIFTSLQQESPLLTVNRRLALFFRVQYDRWQLNTSSEQVWETPTILPIESWLSNCWSQLMDQSDTVWPNQHPPRLLTSLQETALWEEIIENSPQGSPLLRIPSTAGMAAQAWKTTQQYDLFINPSTVLGLEDAEAFLGWSQTFESRLYENHWLSSAQLIDLIRINFHHLEKPKQIHLAGFDSIHPQMNRLLESISNQGTEIQHIPPTFHKRAKNYFYSCLDTASEMTQAAQWAMQCLHDHPDEHIAIVVPDLQSIRTPLLRSLTKNLHSDRCFPGLPDSAPRFNISLGEPLSHQPMIRDALLMLRACHGALSLAQWDRLLLSPFWCNAERELSGRTQLSLSLPDQRRERLTLDHIAKRIHDQPAGLLEQTASQLDQLIQLREQMNNQSDSRPSTWVNLWTKLLSAWQWPGERPLSSAEYQTTTSWSALLEQFTTLDGVKHHMTASSALDQLIRLATDTLFQPESGDAPIQILGMLEAAGESYDHLWVMRLSDEVWPPPPSPNPFLPLEMQKSAGVPRASASESLLFANQLMERLKGAAPSVIFSAPEKEADRQLRPSPLIVSMTPLENTHPWQQIRPQTSTQILLESFQDDQGPPLEEGTTIRGGASLLKQQSLCPFSAFAGYRLNLTAPEDEQDPGLNPMERGQLIHAILDDFWSNLPGSDALKALTPNEIDSRLSTLIQNNLIEQAQLRPNLYSHAFMALEHKRIKQLLLGYLDIERQRSTAFSVEAREKKQHISVGGLTIQVRLDRVDRLDDGSLVLLDYKTGNVSPKEWVGERPKDPQLPLYTLTGGDNIAALAFAQIRHQKIGFSGVSQVPDTLPKVLDQKKLKATQEFENWSELLDYWRETLAHLAHTYKSGHAQVDPLDKACDYCAIGPLCRIHQEEQVDVSSAE